MKPNSASARRMPQRSVTPSRGLTVSPSAGVQPNARNGASSPGASSITTLPSTSRSTVTGGVAICEYVPMSYGARGTGRTV